MIEKSELGDLNNWYVFTLDSFYIHLVWNRGCLVLVIWVESLRELDTEQFVM